jgi:hypothetical protein
MNDLDIRQMVLKIMNKAIEKTENTKAEVFVEFRAHVKILEVRIFENGWRPAEIRTDMDTLVEKRINLDYSKESVLEELQTMYNLIYSL